VDCEGWGKSADQQKYPSQPGVLLNHEKLFRRILVGAVYEAMDELIFGNGERNMAYQAVSIPASMKVRTN